MTTRYEIRISGAGGQGVVLAGVILAEAAGRWQQGLKVVQTVSYGPQVRGGLSSAELVISDEEIDYPKPLALDLLAPFTQEAANEGVNHLKPHGMIIQDPDLVPRVSHGWVAQVPLTSLSLETTGRKQMTNIVTLGLIAGLSPVLDPEALNQALKERAPGGMVDSFLKAAAAGMEAAEQVKEKIVFEEKRSTED